MTNQKTQKNKRREKNNSEWVDNLINELARENKN